MEWRETSQKTQRYARTAGAFLTVVDIVHLDESYPQQVQVTRQDGYGLVPSPSKTSLLSAIALEVPLPNKLFQTMESGQMHD